MTDLVLNRNKYQGNTFCRMIRNQSLSLFQIMFFQVHYIGLFVFLVRFEKIVILNILVNVTNVSLTKPFMYKACKHIILLYSLNYVRLVA